MSHVIEAPALVQTVDPPTPLRQTSVVVRLRSIAIHPAITLTLITVLGGALRFWRLDQPALWGDEVATFRRVCGTFQQLVDQLAVGGFTPLHYLLYYWIKQHAQLTPWMMRLPTAIFGTLLVPAMYFLARQLVRPPVAMLAAVFTACSAYQLNFARDAKMYSDLWLCGTLHMGCFLWWLRTRSGIAWWGWVVAGAAMMGVQFVGAALYPIELLILLTAPNGGWKQIWPMTRYYAWWPIAVIGFPISAWRRRRPLPPMASAGRGFEVLPPSPCTPGEGAGTGLAQSTPVNQITSIAQELSPRVQGEGGRSLMIGVRLAFRKFLRRRRRLAHFAWPTLILFLLGVVVAGAAPYTYYLKFNKFFSAVYNDGQNLNWTRTGIAWVTGYNDGRDGFDLIRYTATAFGFGWEWPRPKQWAAIDERNAKLLIGASVAILIFAMLGALPLTRRLAWSRRRSVLWIAVWLVLPSYAFYCASMNGAVSPITWVQQLLLKNVPDAKWPALPIGATWSATWEVWRHTPVLRGFADAIAASFARVGGGFTRDNFNGISIAVLCVGLLAWIAATLRMNRRSLWVATQALLTILGLFLVCVVLRIAIAHPFPRSVWVPRYLGYCWPAFAILLAVLFYRLPTRPIRWLGISILLVANLSVHAARVLAGSEPPTELMARDVVDSQPPLHSRLFTSIPPNSGSEPATGVLESMDARYYLAILSGKPIGPDEIRGGGFENQFLIGRKTFLNPIEAQVIKTVADVSVEQIIVWQQLQPKEIDLTDSVEKVLPPNWRKVSEQTFAGRDHWTWTDYYTFRRRVYQKR